VPRVGWQMDLQVGIADGQEIEAQFLLHGLWNFLPQIT
jgi:hypothetical protein